MIAGGAHWPRTKTLYSAAPSFNLPADLIVGLRGDDTMDIEEIIKEILSADEVEIMEFDFKDCFVALRGMRDILQNIVDLEDSGLMETPRLRIQTDKARDLLDLW